MPFFVWIKYLVSEGYDRYDNDGYNIDAIDVAKRLCIVCDVCAYFIFDSKIIQKYTSENPSNKNQQHEFPR